MCSLNDMHTIQWAYPIDLQSENKWSVRRAATVRSNEQSEHYVLVRPEDKAKRDSIDARANGILMQICVLILFYYFCAKSNFNERQGNGSSTTFCKPK